MFVPFRTTRTVIQRLLALNTAVTPIDIESRTSDVYAMLDKIINGQDGVVDGTTLQNFWFPTQATEYDVFISHSHNDLDYAVNLASWLERRCGLRCFIDNFDKQKVEQNKQKEQNKKENKVEKSEETPQENKKATN